MTFVESGGNVLFSMTAATYSFSLANYVATMRSTKEIVGKVATWARLLALAFHTAFLGTRYYQTGLTEVHQREVMGEHLTGADWFWTFVSHPPYTNLFESLMFITWVTMVAFSVIEWRWKLRPMGIAAVTLALAGLTEAYIVIDKDLKPLVPALQSKWILIHVGLVFVAYSLFLLAAILGVFYMVRAGVKTSLMGSIYIALCAVITLMAGGAKALLTHAAFEVAPIGLHPERSMSGTIRKVWSSVHYLPAGAEKSVRYWVEVPGVGPLTLVAIAALLGAAFLWWREYRSGQEHEMSGLAWKATLGGFAVLTVALGMLLYKLNSAAPFTPTLEGGTFVNELPFRLSVGSNYSFGLLATVWGGMALFLGLIASRQGLSLRLPEPKKLDEMIYKVIIFAFPFISIGIVLGGMWAQVAWGRFWGWDPKETWALITWAVYAIYLHVRITYGPGRWPSALAVFGFGVVIFTYMGVNLGLTGEGLHVYGAG
jgi:cytochrome c-type biogenesis protein CcsB